MDPLFTFNSLQLRPPSPYTRPRPPHDPPALMKPANGHSREEFGEAGIAGPHNALRPHHPRRHSFHREKESRQRAEARSALGGEQGQAAEKCEKKMKEGEQDHLMFSFRYSRQLPINQDEATVRGRSTTSKRKSKCTEKTLADGSIQQQWMQPGLQPRRRIQSVKMSPRIVVPLSDRKLPKVFKVRQQECLPPIDPVRKYDSLQLRQVRSANRSRCGFPLRFREQLQQLQQLGGLMVQEPSLVPF